MGHAKWNLTQGFERSGTNVNPCHSKNIFSTMFTSACGHLFSELGIFPSLHCMLLLTLLCSIKLNQWHGCIISQSDIHLFTYPVWLFSPFIDQLLLPSSTNWAVSSYFPLSACMVCERFPPLVFFDVFCRNLMNALIDLWLQFSSSSFSSSSSSFFPSVYSVFCFPFYNSCLPTSRFVTFPLPSFP